MMICKQCGVELEDGLKFCPLCNNDTAGGRGELRITHQRADVSKRYLLQQILWQITSILLLSAIVATLIINFSIQGTMTWSIYPVTICLIVFSYASVLALWRSKFISKLIVGWIISAMVLYVVQWYTNANWPIGLALPLLCAINLVGGVLYFVIKPIKVRGLNIVAIVFLAIALVCLIIDGIISIYFQGQVRLQWSVIVAACMLPVTAAILFMYFRTRNNKELQKIFHT